MVPHVTSSLADYTFLDTGLTYNCERLALQPTDIFIEKVGASGEGRWSRGVVEEVFGVFNAAARV